MLNPDRFFSPDPTQRGVARELFAEVKDLPLVCPHGHVDPRLFADQDYQFGSPTELLLIPDHYVFRMLYSQGIKLEALGIAPHSVGGEASLEAVEEVGSEAARTDPRASWQLFADNFHHFLGTPTGIWLTDEFANVFGVSEKLTSQNAQEIYDRIDTRLKSPEFNPRTLYKQFNIEVLHHGYCY